MVQLTISTDFQGVERKLKALQASLRDTVLVRTINKAVDVARVDMSREIRKEFNVSASYVRERLKVRRARYRSGEFRVEAVLIGGDGKRRSANVIAFAARQGKGGVSVKIKRAGGRKVIAGAFIGNKGRTVFRRTTDARLPIEPVRTIDVPQMFTTRRINDAVIRAIRTKLPVIFEREARFALTRLAR